MTTTNNDINYVYNIISSHIVNQKSFYFRFVVSIVFKQSALEKSKHNKANTLICLCQVECKHETWKHKNALFISNSLDTALVFVVHFLFVCKRVTTGVYTQCVLKIFHKYSPFFISQRKSIKCLSHTHKIGMATLYLQTLFDSDYIDFWS